MADDTIFEFEQDMTRAEVANYLRTVADKLDGDGHLDFTAGGQSTTIDVPEHVSFEVELEREPEDHGSSEVSIEFELEWYEDQEGNVEGPGALQIE